MQTDVHVGVLAQRFVGRIHPEHERPDRTLVRQPRTAADVHDDGRPLELACERIPLLLVEGGPGPGLVRAVRHDGEALVEERRPEIAVEGADDAVAYLPAEATGTVRAREGAVDPPEGRVTARTRQHVVDPWRQRAHAVIVQW